MLSNAKKRLSVLLFALMAIPAASAASQPNILILLLDDLGYADVGFMQNSEPDIYTPNIDALANDGVIFTSSYAAHPYCGPSRAGLMTGRYQHNIGSQFNLAGYTHHGVDKSETFFSKVLQDAGYNTGIVGKWHLGEEPRFQPNNRGFDYFYGMLGGGHVYHTRDFVRVRDYNPSNRGVWDYRLPLSLNNGLAPETNYDQNLYITDMFTDAGVNFIQRAERNDNQPFFLMMSYSAPHTPEEAKQSDVTALRRILGNKASNNAKRHEYAAMVYAVDRGVKKIINKLKQTGEYNNTIIIFTSDNGGRLYDANAKNTPLQNGKTSTFEGGIRVPMFIHWPNGNLPKGKYRHVVSSLDLYPTLINLANANKPRNKVLDGKDIMSDVRAGRNARPNSPLYFMMHIPKQNGGINHSAVILNNWKWYTEGNGNWKLFNLNADIGERRPVTSAATKATKQPMLNSIYRWTFDHTRPEFFDSPSYGWEDAWDNNNMPNFRKTFPSLYRNADYTNSSSGTGNGSSTGTNNGQPATGANLITNPGFESGTNAWTLTGNSSITNNKRSGSKAAVIRGSGNINQSLRLQANTQYRLDVWGKVGAQGQSFFVGVTNATTNSLVQNTVINSSGYTKKTITFTTGNNASHNYRFWAWNNKGGQYFVDDFKLTKVGS